MKTYARILIVEDEAIIALGIADCLASMGYDVQDTVAKGEIALQRVADAQPDLVLMDIKLAGRLNGLDTAAQFRALHFDVPVVFLTAYADSALLERAADIGPFGYLVKPFEDRELHATIQVALARHQAEQELRRINRDLDEALAKVKTLTGLVPVCAWCWKVRNDAHFWQTLETYIADRTDARVTHGMCPECQASHQSVADPR